MCDGGRKGSDVFFSAKKVRNAPWEVVGGSRTRYLFNSYVDFTYLINLDLTTYDGREFLSFPKEKAACSTVSTWKIVW